jgi:DDE superfamily endonuclease
MEDVLDLYAERYDPRRPVVGFDEHPLQLLGDTRAPLAAAPGRVRRVDYEYRRNGTANLFTAVEPLAGWRHVEVTHRRTAIDFAQQMRWLVDEAYPNAWIIRVVLDNLNIHTSASLYRSLSAKRGASVGSETGVSPHAQTRQLAERGGMRIGRAGQPVSQPTLAGPRHRPLGGPAWERQRNGERPTIQWLFTTAQARRKLSHAYPIPA